ncbi:MAG: 5'-nucleotidase C-terminal domain-containing protein [Lachnospiraceae bacterium]|nr:5'-nucleotidase C-terminal domain-containing protein [Lachnospiraceae bacterium]
MKIKRVGAFGLIAAVLIAYAGAGNGMITAQAAKKGFGTATVKILSTSDLHGQSVRLNYDSGVESEGSLAQIATVIKKERKNIKHGTTVTVDGGDTVYGIGSESIMKGTVSGTEYMYEEMEDLGYDAITLGNHDFDYGVDYIQNALKSSGMNKKVVLANVTNARTKKNLYPSTKVITKTVKTTTGKKRKVKIGIVGAVTPSLTGHYSWKGIVETQDIVSSVRAGAKSLKKKGCKIVIALIHSGIGAENPKSGADNVGYAVTAIPEVDVVCAGHTHMDFPADTLKADTYYGYSETDGDGLMHGKPLVEEADHGASLGITNVKIGFNRWGTPYVKSAKAKIRKITAADAEDQDIKDINDKYDKQYQKIYDQKITDIDGETDNYFGMIEDNPMIQLCNEAKIHYGLKAVKDLEEPYRSAPVISATEYQLAGGEGASSYIKVDGQISQKDLLNVQSFNQERAKVYYITGAQLKDALEWQVARFYETTDRAANDEWDSETESLVKSGAVPVLTNRYQKGWEGFFVYDGIEYTVNPSVPARYNADGQKVSDSRRITSLTCNGKPVTDDQIFVLVSRHITGEVDAIHNSDIMNKQVLVQKTDHISTMMEDYIKHQTVNGKLYLNTDNNWKVSFAKGDNYIIKSSSEASSIAKTKKWYVGESPASSGYTYYRASFDPADQTDTSGPLVVCAPLMTDTTGDPVTVRVEASDVSGLKEVSYAAGVFGPSDDVWNSGATAVTGNTFTVDTNGTYAVRAVDTLGNATVTFVTVDNIDTSVSADPKLDKLTNRTVTLNGTASPNAQVHMDVSGASYDMTAGADGRFTTKIVPPKAGDTAELYQIDSLGRRSGTEQVTVERTGADTPVVNDMTNTSTAITGIYDDDPLCKIFAIKGNTAYVPKNTVSEFKKSSAYNSSYKIKKSTFKRTGNSFTLKVGDIPVTGDKYTVYGIDWIGRLSTKVELTTKEVAPNQPRLMSVVAEEGVVYGRVPAPTAESYVITVVTDDGSAYQGTAGADGHFGVVTGLLDNGTKLSVTASDVKDGETRTSAVRTINAKTYLSFISEFSGGTHFDRITDEDTEVSGKIYDGNESTEARLIIGGKAIKLNEEGSGAVIDSNGKFTYTLPKSLKAGTKIGIVIRNDDHSMAYVDQKKVIEADPDDD